MPLYQMRPRTWDNGQPITGSQVGTGGNMIDLYLDIVADLPCQTNPLSLVPN